jgi:DNA modification methylase
MTWEIREGRNLDLLAAMPDESVQTCVTSPPYWGLRDYGEDDQLGLEPTPEEYVKNIVAVFREVRRVLRDDGTLWLNLGDSYAQSVSAGTKTFGNPEFNKNRPSRGATKTAARAIPADLKPKDLVGIPWRVAFALQADGWYLRSDIIWHKPNPMPESVTDRPTKAHEYIFLLTKSSRYYYDADAIREQHKEETLKRIKYGLKHKHPAGVGIGIPPVDTDEMGERFANARGRNRRSVWTVTTKPFSGAHFAVFPPDLIEPCVLAGAAPGDTVLDPFSGSGTTGMVALRQDRSYIGLELNPEYAEMSRNRIRDDAPLLNTGLEAS